MALSEIEGCHGAHCARRSPPAHHGQGTELTNGVAVIGMGNPPMPMGDGDVTVAFTDSRGCVVMASSAVAPGLRLAHVKRLGVSV